MPDTRPSWLTRTVDHIANHETSPKLHTAAKAAVVTVAVVAAAAAIDALAFHGKGRKALFGKKQDIAHGLNGEDVLAQVSLQ